MVKEPSQGAWRSHSPLFAWPEAARLDRVIPKERLYSEAGASTALKQRFIDQVQKVRWAYNLSERSIRLRGSDAVPEIQIFVIELKGGELHDSVLVSIDKSVPSPIFFELHRVVGETAEVQPAAAYKTPGLRGPKLSQVFYDTWSSAGTPRVALPQAITLEALYFGLLASLLPVETRPGEELSVLIERTAEMQRLQRDVGVLERRLRTEPQLNRKIEIRRELKTMQNALEALQGE